MDSDNDNEDKFSTTQPFNYAEPDQPASPDPEEYDENEYSDARNANSLYQQSYSSTQPFSFGTDDAPASPVPEDDADEADGQQHGDSGLFGEEESAEYDTQPFAIAEDDGENNASLVYEAQNEGNDHEEIAVGAASLTSQESFKLNDSFNIEENLPESPDAMLKNLERIEGVNAETEDSNVDQEADDSPQEPEEAEVAEEVEGEEEGNVVKEMFGEESDAEEFEGFEPGEVATEGLGDQADENDGLDDDDDDVTGSQNRRGLPSDFEYDFDIMMRKRKEETGGRMKRRRPEGEFISDADEMIQFVIEQMREAYRMDQESNRAKQPALQKRKLLPTVLRQLRKHDLQPMFIENGVVNVLTDWLSPLPDKSLPALEIRSQILKMLADMPPIDSDTLKSSNIGKAVMYLYRHPKEMKENKRLAAKLISIWARPIFNLNTDFRSLTKEEREQRDYELLAKKRKSSVDEVASSSRRLSQDEERSMRPGEKGFIPRARVPQPSTKDYVVRPKSTIDEARRGAKKDNARLDRKLREFKERTKMSKAMHAVTVNVSGNKMT